MNLLDKITIVIDTDNYEHIFYIWFFSFLVFQLIIFVVFSSRYPRIISLIGSLHHIFVSMYSFVFFFFIYFLDTATKSKYAIYPLAFSLSYLFIDILNIIGKPDYSLLTKMAFFFHHLFMLILGFYAITNIASFCIFGVEILESSSVFYNLYNFTDESHPKRKFFMFTCFVIFFFLTRFVLYPFLIGHCFDNFTPFIFVIGIFFQLLMCLWMFVIVKKYRNMLSKLFDGDYNEEEDFDLTGVKMNNIKKIENQPNCMSCSELCTMETFKGLLSCCCSCTCFDCDIEEYDESDDESDDEEYRRKKKPTKRNRKNDIELEVRE